MNSHNVKKFELQKKRLEPILLEENFSKIKENSEDKIKGSPSNYNNSRKSSIFLSMKNNIISLKLLKEIIKDQKEIIIDSSTKLKCKNNSIMSIPTLNIITNSKVQKPQNIILNCVFPLKNKICTKLNCIQITNNKPITLEPLNILDIQENDSFNLEIEKNNKFDKENCFNNKIRNTEFIKKFLDINDENQTLRRKLLDISKKMNSIDTRDEKLIENFLCNSKEALGSQNEIEFDNNHDNPGFAAKNIENSFANSTLVNSEIFGKEEYESSKDFILENSIKDSKQDPGIHFINQKKDSSIFRSDYYSRNENEKKLLIEQLNQKNEEIYKLYSFITKIKEFISNLKSKDNSSVKGGAFYL